VCGRDTFFALLIFKHFVDCHDPFKLSSNSRDHRDAWRAGDGDRLLDGNRPKASTVDCGDLTARINNQLAETS